MTDPILYISMFLGLVGIYTLITSFGDDDDDNGGDGKKYIYNLELVKTPKFEAKEQFTNSALENLKSEKERLINNLIDSGEFKPNI